MFGFALILYILVCVVIGGMVLNKFYSSGQSVAAMISLVLLILLFTFFGLRWFDAGELKGTKKGGVAWPPIVNMCPDYMTAVKGQTTATPSKQGTFCIDTKNLFTTPLANMVDVRPEGTETTFKGFLIKDESNSSTRAFTSLREDTSGTPRWPLLRTLQRNPQEIVGQGDGQHFRWEGVWDGRNATAERAPLP